MRSEDVVEVYWARDAQDAHRIVAMLKANGIPAKVVGETLEGVAIEMMFVPSISPRVWVPRSCEAKAIELIEAAKTADDSATAWVCARCGAEVDAGFEICWSCQAPRA